MRLFLDTNIFVCAYGRDDVPKRDLAREVITAAMSGRELVVSTQVLVEFYSISVGRRLVAPAEALELISLWSQHDTIAHTPDLVLRGIELQQRHSLSVWDALIVQAAIDARCDLLLTEDMQHGRRFGDLEIRNPFSAGAHEPRSKGYRARRSRRSPQAPGSPPARG